MHRLSLLQRISTVSFTRVVSHISIITRFMENYAKWICHRKNQAGGIECQDFHKCLRNSLLVSTALNMLILLILTKMKIKISYFPRL